MNNNTSSEQPNPETEQDDSQAEMTMPQKTVIALMGLALVAIMVMLPGRAIYNRYIKDLGTVSCHKCGHVVKKSTATPKKQFKHLVGKDGDFNKWWFCMEHAPAWDYAIHDRFFKNQMDLECSENGQVLTNREIYWSLAIGTNGTWVVSTNTTVGGSMTTKHIDY